jgi:hypothetical protein
MALSPARMIPDLPQTVLLHDSLITLLTLAGIDCWRDSGEHPLVLTPAAETAAGFTATLLGGSRWQRWTSQTRCRPRGDAASGGEAWRRVA